jgi:hypothetical protein
MKLPNKLYYRYLRSKYTKRQIGYHGMILTVILELIVAFMLFSCSPGEILTAEHGRVIHYDANSVTVEFDTFKKKKKKGIYKYTPTEKKALNAFYLPSGHKYQLGDVWGCFRGFDN